MAEQESFLATSILTRIDSIIEKSAKIFDFGYRISVLGKSHYSLPNLTGFTYSFEFEESFGFIKIDWFRVDSMMQTFPVSINSKTIDEIKDNFVNPLLKSIFNEIRSEFLTNISDFSNLHYQVLDGCDLSDAVVFQLDIFQISPYDKKVVHFIFPRKTLFKIFCSKQFLEIEELSQNEIDEIAVNITQKENKIEIDGDFSENIEDFDDFSKEDYIIKENCKYLSIFMSDVAKKIQKTFQNYRDGEYKIVVKESSICSELRFASLATQNDFVVSSKIGGNLFYLCWNKVFFAKTFLQKNDFEGELQRVESEIFKNEYAIPIFDCLKSLIELKIKRYLIITSTNFCSFADKDISSENDGFLVSLKVSYKKENANAFIFIPKNSIEIMQQAAAFSSSEENKMVKWQFPIGSFKNTNISLGSFIFDEQKFNSGKTFILEKEIGDTVEIVRNTKLLARGEVFVKNKKIFVKIKEVYGMKNLDNLTEKNGDANE